MKNTVKFDELLKSFDPKKFGDIFKSLDLGKLKEMVSKGTNGGFGTEQIKKGLAGIAKDKFGKIFGSITGGQLSDGVLNDLGAGKLKDAFSSFAKQNIPKLDQALEGFTKVKNGFDKLSGVLDSLESGDYKTVFSKAFSKIPSNQLGGFINKLKQTNIVSTVEAISKGEYGAVGDKLVNVFKGLGSEKLTKVMEKVTKLDQLQEIFSSNFDADSFGKMLSGVTKEGGLLGDLLKTFDADKWSTAIQKVTEGGLGRLVAQLDVNTFKDRFKNMLNTDKVKSFANGKFGAFLNKLGTKDLSKLEGLIESVKDLNFKKLEEIVKDVGSTHLDKVLAKLNLDSIKDMITKSTGGNRIVEIFEKIKDGDFVSLVEKVAGEKVEKLGEVVNKIKSGNLKKLLDHLNGGQIGKLLKDNLIDKFKVVEVFNKIKNDLPRFKEAISLMATNIDANNNEDKIKKVVEKLVGLPSKVLETIFNFGVFENGDKIKIMIDKLDWASFQKILDYVPANTMLKAVKQPGFAELGYVKLANALSIQALAPFLKAAIGSQDIIKKVLLKMTDNKIKVQF